jgi:secretion/DNA translocation related TadE-like protein
MTPRPAPAGNRRPRVRAVRAGRRRFTDRGSATVLGVGVIAVLCAVFGLVLALGQAVIVRHRAAGGADLAALAAADHWAEGTAAACARADRVARAQGARLVRCVISGEVSDVTVASGTGPFTAETRARAGPAGPEPGSDSGSGPGSASGAGADANPGPGPGAGTGPGLGTGPGPGSGLGSGPGPGSGPGSGSGLGSGPGPGPGTGVNPGPEDVSGAAVPDAGVAAGVVRPSA